MIQDPKQIVTPHAFEVSPDLLGLPLATPKRRLFALLLDLLIASILTLLGAFVLAFAVAGIFFWLAIKSRGSVWWRNLIRYSVAGFASFIIFGITYYFADSDAPSEKTVNVNNQPVAASDSIDWAEFTKAMLSTDFTNEESIDSLENRIEQIAGVVDNEDSSYFNPGLFEKDFILQLSLFSTALQTNDSLVIDSLRASIAPVIASAELNKEKAEVRKYRNRADRLSDKNDELEEEVDNPSLTRMITATAEDFGLRFGWVGIYFIICLPLFSGQTLGKRLLSLRVVRLNNKPIGIWYSFERFGGYAAGIATGLLGFIQVFWDPNRQAIHDKIAGTVVIDQREKRKQKYAALRDEIIRGENLLDQF